MKKNISKNKRRAIALCMAITIAAPHSFSYVFHGINDEDSQITANEDILISSVSNLLKKTDIDGEDYFYLKPEENKDYKEILFDDSKLDIVLEIKDELTASENIPDEIYCEDTDETYYAKDYILGYALGQEGIPGFPSDILKDDEIKPIEKLSEEMLSNGTEIAIYVKPVLKKKEIPVASPTDATPTDATPTDATPSDAEDLNKCAYSFVKMYKTSHSTMTLTDLIWFAAGDNATTVEDGKAYNHVFLKSADFPESTVGSFKYSYCLDSDFNADNLDSLEWLESASEVELDKETAVEDKYIGIVGYFVDSNNDGTDNKLVSYSKTKPVMMDVTDPEVEVFVKKSNYMDSDNAFYDKEDAVYYLGKNDINKACIFVKADGKVTISKIVGEDKTECRCFTPDNSLCYTYINDSGNLDYYIEVVEDSGNTSSLNISVVVDTEAPVIDVEDVLVGDKQVTDNEIITGENLLSFKVTENTDFPLICTVKIKNKTTNKLEKALFNEKTGRYEVILPNDKEDTYDITINATDSSGNMAVPYSFSYVFDNTMPQIENAQLWYKEKGKKWTLMPDEWLYNNQFTYNKADNFSYSITVDTEDANIDHVKMGKWDFVRTDDGTDTQSWRCDIPDSWFESDEFTPFFGEIVATDKTGKTNSTYLASGFRICKKGIYIKDAVLIDRYNNAVALSELDDVAYTNSEMKLRAKITSDYDISNAALILKNGDVYADLKTITSETDEISRLRSAVVEFTIFKNTDTNTILDDMYLYGEDAEGKSSETSLFTLFLDKTYPCIETDPKDLPEDWVMAPYSFDITVKPGEMADNTPESGIKEKSAYYTINNKEVVDFETYEETDGLSIARTTVDVPVSTDIKGTDIRFFAQDRAGNYLADNVYKVKVDGDAPKIISVTAKNDKFDASNPLNGIIEVSAKISDLLTLDKASYTVTDIDGNVVTEGDVIINREISEGDELICEIMLCKLDISNNGVYEIMVSAWDMAGNKTTLEKPYRFTVDNSNPIVRAGSEDNFGSMIETDDLWHSDYNLNYAIMPGLDFADSEFLGKASYTVVYDSTKKENVQLPILDNGKYKGCSIGTINIPESTLVSGTTIIFDAADNAGNNIEAPCSFTYKIDKTAPYIEYLHVNDTNEVKTYNYIPEISLMVKDNLTLDKANIEVITPDGRIIDKDFDVNGEKEGIKQLIVYNLEEETPVNGEYIIKARVWDKAGNQSLITAFKFYYDKTEPRVMYSDKTELISDGLWHNDNPMNKEYLIDSGYNSVSKLSYIKYDITNSVNDVSDIIEIPFNCSEISQNIIIPESADVEGTRLQFSILDNASNYKEAEVIYKLDVHNPVINDFKIDDFTSFNTFGKEPKIYFSVSDNLSLDKVEITVKYPDGSEKVRELNYNSELKDISVNCELPLDDDGEVKEDGEYEVSIRVTDMAGNEAFSQVNSFGLDRVMPRILNEDGTELVNDNIWYSDDSFIKNYLIDSGNASGQSALSLVTYDISGSVENSSANVTVSDNTSVTHSINIPESADVYGTKVSFKAVDLAGNTSFADVSYRLDKHNPEISALKVNGMEACINPLNNIPVVEIGVTDNLSIKKAYVEVLKPDGKVTEKISLLDNGSIESKDADVKKTYSMIDLLGNSNISDGAYLVKVYAEDMSGRNVSREIIFEIDNTLPMVSVAINDGVTANKAPQLNGFDMYYRSDVTVGFACIEKNFDSNTVIIKDNGREVKPLWSELNHLNTAYYVASQEGIHNIEITVCDKANNNSSTRNLSFVIDKELPALGLSLNGSPYNDGNIDLSSDAGISVSIMDTNPDETDINIRVSKTVPDHQTVVSEFSRTGEHQFRFSEEAEYVIEFYAVDMAGNIGNTRSVRFRIDKTAPSITISGVSANGTYNTAATMSFTMTEAYWWDASGDINIYRKAGDGFEESLYKTIDFKPTGNVTTISESFTDSGMYRAEFSGSDKLGHSANASQSVVIDRNAPVVSMDGVSNYDVTENNIELLVEILDEFYLSKTVSITGTREDINGIIENIEFDYNPKSNPTRINKIFETDGIYDINLVAKDMADNVTEKSVHFTIDKTAPVIGDLSRYEGATVNKFDIDIDLDEFVTDLTSCESHMYLNGSEYDGMADLKDGAYTLYITASDELGHTSEKSVEFVLDTKSPVFIITGIEDGDIKEESFDVSVSLQLDEDILDKVTLNGKEMTLKNNSCSFTVSEDGNYELVLKAHDIANNEAEKTITFKYKTPMSGIWYWIIGVFVLSVLTACIIFTKSNKKTKE